MDTMEPLIVRIFHSGFWCTILRDCFAKTTFWGHHLVTISTVTLHPQVNPTLNQNTTKPLKLMKVCLHILDQSANKKLYRATLDGAAPYLNTQRFLPLPWNDVTLGAQNMKFIKPWTAATCAPVIA